MIAILGVLGAVLYNYTRPVRLQPHVWIKELSSDRTARTLTICPQHGYLVEVLEDQHQVAILDAVSGQELAMLGVRDEVGDDQHHFRSPYGATCDEKRGRILVSEPSRRRVRIFDIDSFAYRESVATPVAVSALTMDAKGDRIFAIVRSKWDREASGTVWVLDGATLAPTGREIGVLRYQGELNDLTLIDPKSIIIDTTHDHLLVLDGGDYYMRGRVLVFDLDTLAYVTTIGAFYHSSADGPHPLEPANIAADDAVGHILIGDQHNHCIRILDGARFTDVNTIDSRNFFLPTGIAAHKGLIFIQRSGGWLWREGRSAPDHIDMYSSFISRNPTP